MKFITFEQFLPIDLETAWAFFSSPANLNEITPPEMTFKITSELPASMYQGMLISYIVSPLPLYRMKWITEITHIKDHQYFIDEQRMGPYRIWHHEHHFRKTDGGVIMTDKLCYVVGMGPLGKIASFLFVDRAVQRIFNYRFKKLEALFGKKA